MPMTAIRRAILRRSQRHQPGARLRFKKSVWLHKTLNTRTTTMKAETTTATIYMFMLLCVAPSTAFNWFGAPKTTKSHTAAKPTPKLVVPPSPPKEEPMFELPDIDVPNPLTPGLWNGVTSALLGLAARMAPRDIQNQQNKDRAARIAINRIPPQSIKVDLSDVPLVGRALSGTYAKVKDENAKRPASVVIASPKDKVGFVQQAIDEGNIDLGLSGLLSTNIDIQLEPNRPGVAPVQLKSPLIPKWPFGVQSSDWNRVTNLGSGRVYYFNSRTGQVQYEEPDEI